MYVLANIAASGRQFSCPFGQKDNSDHNPNVLANMDIRQLILLPCGHGESCYLELLGMTHNLNVKRVVTMKDTMSKPLIYSDYNV